MRPGVAITASLTATSLLVTALLIRREAGPTDVVTSVVTSESVRYVVGALPAIRHRGNTRDPHKTVLLFLDYIDPRAFHAYSTVDSLLMIDPHSSGYVLISLPKDKLLEHSTEAATEVECASAQGRFRQSIETLMRNASVPISTNPDHLADAAFIPDKTAFDNCLKSSVPAQALIRDAALADSVGVGNSPVIVVNNHRYQQIPGARWLAEQLHLASK